MHILSVLTTPPSLPPSPPSSPTLLVHVELVVVRLARQEGAFKPTAHLEAWGRRKGGREGGKEEGRVRIDYQALENACFYREGKAGEREGGREGLLTFGGREGHAGLGELGLEFVEDGGTKAGRDVAGNALHHAWRGREGGREGGREARVSMLTRVMLAAQQKGKGGGREGGSSG